MTQIAVGGVGVEFGATTLFTDVTFTIASGERWGVVGRNGTGKTTLFKLLTGDLVPQKGTVARPERLGVLRQDQFAFDQFRVIDAVIMGNAVLWAALVARAEAAAPA